MTLTFKIKVEWGISHQTNAQSDAVLNYQTVVETEINHLFENVSHISSQR